MSACTQEGCRFDSCSRANVFVAGLIPIPRQVRVHGVWQALNHCFSLSTPSTPAKQQWKKCPHSLDGDFKKRSNIKYFILKHCSRNFFLGKIRSAAQNWVKLIQLMGKPCGQNGVLCVGNCSIRDGKFFKQYFSSYKINIILLPTVWLYFPYLATINYQTFNFNFTSHSFKLSFLLSLNIRISYSHFYFLLNEILY